MSNPAISTAGNPFWTALSAFGAGILDSGSEVANVWAQAKLREELGINDMLNKQRINDATSNAEVLALSAPAKGTNSDGSTVIESVEFAGISMQKNTLKIAGGITAALLLGVLTYKALS